MGDASGPPSSVDIGAGGDYGDSSTSASSTYWEKKFGGGGGDGSSDNDSSGNQPDFSSFGPTYTATDEVLSLIRLGLACVFLVVGVFALVKFYRSRWILDIRTRSANLVMLEGACVILTMLVSINSSLNVVWDSGLRWFWSSLLLFFITPALFGSYICRALRLAVVFHPCAKRVLPWLIPERNYMWFLLVASVGMLAIPIYHEYTLHIWEIIPLQTDILVKMSITFAVALACVYPFIRKVDDLFNISTELFLVTVAVVLLAAGQKLTQEYGGTIGQRWFANNSTLFFALFVFGVSVVDPLRRLAFDPQAATKRNYADRVLLNRKKGSSTVRTISSGMSSALGGESEDEGRAMRIEEGRALRPGNDAIRPAQAEDDTAGAPWTASTGGASGQRRGGGGGAGGEEQGVWDFERLATTPLLASAFEDFSRRALCHESVLFLSEVSRYQSDDFSTPTGSSSEPSQFGAFSYITDTFVKAGSRDEVNISDSDKKRIVRWYNKGKAWFDLEDDEEKRMVFGQAYTEVKSMLEANLLQRFLQTDQFKSLRAQRENITMMMVSPPK